MDYDYAFRPGELDRAAQLRAGEASRQDEAARSYVFWHGKLLVDGENQPVLVRLDHPALGDCRESPVFLGLGVGAPRFAADLVLWKPHEDAATIGQFTDASHQIHPGFPEARLVEIRGVMSGLSLLDGECVAVGRALHGWHGTHRFCANCGGSRPSFRAGKGRARLAEPIIFHAPTRW